MQVWRPLAQRKQARPELPGHDSELLNWASPAGKPQVTRSGVGEFTCLGQCDRGHHWDLESARGVFEHSCSKRCQYGTGAG
jgi:hypothetical protein